MLARIAAGLLLAAVVLAVGYLFLLGMPIQATSSVNPSVTIECSGTTRVPSAAACRAWGDSLLAAGAPSTTFELEDVERLVLNRPLFGFAGMCEAEWFLGRFPDDPVWDDEVACREA